MNTHGKMTAERFQLLKLVDEICRKDKFKVAPAKELINIITSQRNIKSGGVRKMLWELGQCGYLESPLRGCWRLTDKSRKLLDDVGRH